MERCTWKLSVLWILLAMPLAASTTRIYVTSQDAIDVIDPLTNKIVQTIKGIAEPHGIVFSPDGSRVYVTSQAPEHSLSVVDTKTGKITNKLILRSGKLQLPAITKDGSRIFVCVREPGRSVDIVDTDSLKVVKSLPMKGAMHDCFTTPDGKYVVAGSTEGKFAVAIDVQTEQPAWEVPFDNGVLPFAMEANADRSTRRIYVQLRQFYGFAVVDFATHKEVARVKFPEQSSAPMNGENEPAHGIGVAPDGKTLWANSAQANSVFAYSLPNLKLLGQVPTPKREVPSHPAAGGWPHWLTFTPDSKTIYVASADADAVSAIDVKTRKEVARIRVSKNPRRIDTLVLP